MKNFKELFKKSNFVTQKFSNNYLTGRSIGLIKKKQIVSYGLKNPILFSLGDTHLGSGFPIKLLNVQDNYGNINWVYRNYESDSTKNTLFNHLKEHCYSKTPISGRFLNTLSKHAFSVGLSGLVAVADKGPYLKDPAVQAIDSYIVTSLKPNVKLSRVPQKKHNT